jgi:hypothetical protein
VAQPYRLWTQARSWCDYELTTDKEFLPAIRSLFPPLWPGGTQQLSPDVELIPEPDGPRGQWAVSVRAEGRTLGYIGADDAPAWAGVVRRVIASGFVPTTGGRIWANEYDGWDGVEFSAGVRIALGEPGEALPMNDPPAVPFTMLPRSSLVQVTKEDEHFGALLKFVPNGGYGTLFVTLHERPSGTRAKPHVEVRIDDECVGELAPQMSQRFLPMIRHLQDRGLLTACWGDITGSTVAAEVRIDAIKANEATPTVLDGPPATVPRLRPELSDVMHYDIGPMRSQLQPLSLVQRAVPPTPPEPPDGSVVRFDKSRGRYNYVAVRRADHWETTATADWGSINEKMEWHDLATRVPKFDIATAWDAVDIRNDLRVREHLAVVRFTISRLYLAAINVSDDDSHDGDWYTTITHDAEQQLPFGDNAEWSDITRYGEYIQVATEWAQLI